MLEGLLTILIPQRLGSLSQYELFSDHSWFQLYEFNNPNKLGDIESPLMYERPYLWKLKQIRQEDLEEINDDIGSDPTFTPEIKRKLMTYNYGSETYEISNEENIQSDVGETKLQQPFSSAISTTPLTLTHQYS